MIAIDTSSFIAYLSGAAGVDVDAVGLALAHRQAVLPPVVLSELLSDPELPRAVKPLFVGLPMLPLSDGYWERAGLLRARVLARRAQGAAGGHAHHPVLPRPRHRARHAGHGFPPLRERRRPEAVRWRPSSLKPPEQALSSWQWRDSACPARLTRAGALARYLLKTRCGFRSEHHSKPVTQSPGSLFTTVSPVVSRRFDRWVSASVDLAAVAGPLRRWRPHPSTPLMRRGERVRPRP